MTAPTDLQARRAARERGRLYSLADVLHIAEVLHEMAEYRANGRRGDLPTRDWHSLSAEIQWHYFQRAQATCDDIDASRLGAGAVLEKAAA